MPSIISGVAAGSLLLIALSAPAGAQLLGWKKKVDVAGIGNPLAYNPSNHATIFGAGLRDSNGTVMVSYDRGGKWQELSVVAGGGRIKSIIIRPADSLTILVGQEGTVADRVMKTTDGGISWAKTLEGDFAYYGVPLEFNEAHPDTVFTMMGSSLYRSTDFGSSWRVMNGATGINAWCDAALRPDSVNVLYIGDNVSGIWKTADGGATMKLVYATTGEIPMIAIDQRNPATAYATEYGGGGGLLRTTDFGETWSQVFQFNGVQCWGVALGVDEPGLILVGAYGAPYTTYLSPDNGTSWREISCGLTSLLNYGALVLDSAAMFALQGDGLYALQRIDPASQPTSAIGGVVEDSATHAPVEAVVTLSYARCDTPMTRTEQTDTLGRFFFDHLSTSDPPVLSTYTLGIDPILPFGHLSVAPIHLDTTGSAGAYPLRRADILLAGNDTGGYAGYYTAALDSLGIAWNFWNTTLKGAAPFGSCGSLSKNAAICFTGNDVNPLDSATLAGMSAAFKGGTGLFLTGQDIAERNDSSLSHFLGVGFAGNTQASYVEGKGWDLMQNLAFFTSGGTGAQNQFTRDILVPRASGPVPLMDYIGLSDTATAVVRVPATGGSGRAVVAGFGFEAIGTESGRKEMMRRVVGYLDGSIVAGIAERGARPLPQEAALRQNFPNPFNPSTVIRFDVPAGHDHLLPCRVSLRVYNVLGQEVATLVDEALLPGTYTALWDAARFPSGVYYYSLSTPQATVVKKMSLVK